MIEVTAAIDGEGPNLRSQICAARSIGSNGNSSGLPTGTTVEAPSTCSLIQQFSGGLERVQGAVGDLPGQLVEPALGQPPAQRGEGQRGELLARPGQPPVLQLAGVAEPGPV